MILHLVDAPVSLQRLTAVEHPLTNCDSAWGVHIEQSHSCCTGRRDADDLCAAEFKVLFPDVPARVEEIDRLATLRARLDLAPYKGSRNDKRNACDIKRHRPSRTYPVVSLPGLLSLADWAQNYCSTHQGGDRCTQSRKVKHPPALEQTTSSASTTVGDAARTDAAADADQAQPDRHAATRATTGQEGGDA